MPSASLTLCFTGFDLPVWSAETEVRRTPQEFRAAAIEGEPSFVRSTRLMGLGFTSLQTCLEVADQEFAVAADMCGAKVVEHEWGLKPRTPADTDAYGRLVYPENLVPEGYVLVAQVQTLPNLMPISAAPDHRHDITQGVEQYQSRQADSSIPTLNDITPAQFTVQHTPQGSQRWLVDIEPRFNGFF
jgi:hypothetical protein